MQKMVNSNLSQNSNFIVGVGLRHTHFPYILEGGEIHVDFFEAISENFINTRGRPFKILEKVRRDYPIALHGVSLSIASNSELDYQYLSRLKELYSIIDPFITSDHLCWTGHSHNNLHNLLPFAYTEASLDYVCDRVVKVQEFLGRQMVFENLSAYFTHRSSTMTEIEFIKQLCKRAGCKQLFDVNNIYVNSVNQKFELSYALSQIDYSSVGQVHLAGFTDFGDYLFDTHSAPVFPEVWEIFSDVSSKLPPIPILIEWDEDIPEFPIVQNEALKAKEVLKRVTYEA
ncbi:MAG: DUF692 domain-containing protein [Bacteriovoracaceae bacterium]